MSTTELIEIINKLPVDKQKEVADFVTLLTEKVDMASKTQQKTDPDNTKRGFGSMKGLIKYMAEDFDEPLEDFKDYM